jgi:hypothetical protein
MRRQRLKEKRLQNRKKLQERRGMISKSESKKKKIEEIIDVNMKIELKKNIKSDNDILIQYNIKIQQLVNEENAIVEANIPNIKKKPTDKTNDISNRIPQSPATEAPPIQNVKNPEIKKTKDENKKIENNDNFNLLIRKIFRANLNRDTDEKSIIRIDNYRNKSIII